MAIKTESNTVANIIIHFLLIDSYGLCSPFAFEESHVTRLYGPFFVLLLSVSCKLIWAGHYLEHDTLVIPSMYSRVFL